jgi:hypothetical protein
MAIVEAKFLDQLHYHRLVGRIPLDASKDREPLVWLFPAGLTRNVSRELEMHILKATKTMKVPKSQQLTLRRTQKQ